MGNNHSYGLEWIDEDALFEVTKKTFDKVLNPQRKQPLPPDPFTIIAHATVMGGSLTEALMFEKERSLNKTLSDNVGYWHQRVLGLSPNWQETGSSGGNIDLKTNPGFLPPSVGRPVYAEVKNRFNTIKGSDQKNLWDDLERHVKANGAVGYVFQIIPKKAERYDQPWKVAGRPVREDIRHCDGVTAYELVYGEPEALFQLYRALPLIFRDIIGSDSLVEGEIAELFFRSLPSAE
ncbi:Eco47II family restriction endonuclease [Arcanobacterium phocae]|uniref:Eco47II family restriction endonuclease n=1 Tax=Arcanobacterium phocae TaxID=131112 RepID=UPI001C0EA08B|nr:Eco47II family restriction endonuclease [Arcanobacterium phocae]